MAAGVHIQEPVLNTLRKEDEIEKLMDQGSNITLVKIVVEGNIGAIHTPVEPQDSLETDFEVKDSVKGNEGRASTTEGDKYLESPSAAEVYFEENNLAPDACQVTENEGENHETDVSHDGEAELDTEESALVVAATREVGDDESIPVHEAGLPEIKENRERMIPEEEEAVHIEESLNVKPEDTKTCVTVHDTEATSSVEEKSMISTSQEIPGENIDTKEETPEDISTVVPNEVTEQNLSIEVDDDSQMKHDEKLEKEDEKDGSTLVPEAQIKDEESTVNELFETEKETETVIKDCGEVIEKGVESSPVAASVAEDIKASNSDLDTKTSALEKQIPTENPQEVEVDKSECKPENETLEEQVEEVSTLSSMTDEDDSLTKHETHSEKESEKPSFTDDETTPVDKATTEDEEPSKSDLFENEEDTESTIPVEEPIIEKHLESLNAVTGSDKACDLVQDTEAKSSIKEKLPAATPQETWGDKIEQTTFDTKEETPENISTHVSTEETEQNSIVEVPFVAEALTTDNELTVTEGEIKDEDQRETDLLENNNDTEGELLKQGVTEKLVESLQLGNEAEDTKTSTSDHDMKISALENLIITENPQEIVADVTESKSCDVVDTKMETLDSQDVSITGSNDDIEENSMIGEDESEKPLLREEPNRDAAADESIYTQEDKNEGEDQRKAELFENQNSAEIMSSEEDNTTLKHVESPQVDAKDIKTHVLDQEAETAGLVLETEEESSDGKLAVKYEVKTEDDGQKVDQLCDIEKNPESDVKLEVTQIETPTEFLQETLPSVVPQGLLDDETEENTVDAIQKEKAILDIQHDVSTIELNDDHEETSVIGENDSQMKNEENLGEKIKKTSSIEASRTDASNDEPTKKRENKSEDKEQMRAESFKEKEGTEITLLKEEETAAQPLDSPKVDVEDIKTYVSDEGKETVGQVEVFERVANDDDPEVERNEEEDPKKDELCDTENIPDSALLLEAAHTEKFLESSQEALPNSFPESFPDENIEENATATVSKENIEDDSLLQVDGSQIQPKEYPEEESEITSIIEASIKNNDENSVNVHEDSSENEDLRKHGFGDTKITSQEEEAQIETPANSLNIAAEDVVASDSCQEAETRSQEERTFNEEETVCEQIEVETLDTADTKMQTLEAQDVSTIVPTNDSGENSVTEKNDLTYVPKASTADASGEDSANNCGDKFEGEEQTGAELFEGKKDMGSKLLKEEDKMDRLVESPQEETEDIKTVSDENAKTTGIVEASQGDADNDEYHVKNEDELFVNVKNPESSELLEAAQTEKPIESLQESVPSVVPQEFPYDNTEEITVDALQKDEDNVTITVPNEKIEENSLKLMDGSKKHVENLEKEHEIPSVIEASIENVNDDELVVHEDKIIYEDPRKVEFESERDTEIRLQEDDTQIETHIKSLQVAAEDIIASKSYPGTETTDSQAERILDENDIMQDETDVERLDAADTKKETPMALDVSTIALDDDNEEHFVIGVDHSEMKNEVDLGKESENPSSMEASPNDASGYESTRKCEDKSEGEEQTRGEDTGSILFKEAETASQPLESPQVDAEDIKTYVSETTNLIEVFEDVHDDNQPEVKCTINEDESCDNDKAPDSTLLLEVAEKEKAFECLEEALPTSVPRGFLDKKAEEKTIYATEEDVQSRELQKVTTIVSNENIEHDSLIQVDGSQMQCKENSEDESEETPSIEALTKNVNDDIFINVQEDSTGHEDTRKDELVESKEDTTTTSQKEEVQVETPVKSSQIAVEDTIESDSCQQTETMSSQGDQTLNEEEIVREQIEVETLDTAETPEAKEISTFVSGDDGEANSATGGNDLQPSVVEASAMDASGDGSTNKREDKVDGKEQMGTEMFVDKKDTESTLLKEEEMLVKLVEPPQVDTENIKSCASDEGVEIKGVVEAFERDADDDESVNKYEVKTEDNDQKEDKLCDNAKNFDSGALLEATQIEKPIESLQETLPSIVPRELLHDETEEITMDAVEKDEEILDIQNVAKKESDENIENNSLKQADSSQIQHEEYLEKKIEIQSMVEVLTKNANDDELLSIHEDNIELKDHTKFESLEHKKDAEINLQEEEVLLETPVNSLQVAAEDIIIASDSNQETETTSQEDTLLNENRIICEQREVEKLQTADSAKEIPEAQNFATLLSTENKEYSLIPEDGSELKHDELFEKENSAPPLSETLIMEANYEVPEIIHLDKIEDGKLEKVDKFGWDEPEEITLLNEEAPAGKLNVSSKEDLEDIKVIVSGANTTERSLMEVQSLNKNQQETVGNHKEENIVHKHHEETEDEHLDKGVMFENEAHVDIGFTKEEEPLKELHEPEKIDVEEIKAFVYEGAETASSTEERKLTEFSQESASDPSADNILAKAQDVPDFTPIVSDDLAEKNSSIQPDGSQMKHEELYEMECKLISPPETSFLYSSSNEPMTVDVENIENEHLNKVHKFEDEKHTEIAVTSDQASVEDPQESSRSDIEEVKTSILLEGAATSSIQDQCSTEISPEIKGDMLEEKILDKESTKFVSDENSEDISLKLVDELQIKQEELLEKESDTSPLSETSLQNSNFNQDKIEDELLNRVHKFESGKHSDISLIKEEAPLEKLNEGSLRTDLDEIKGFDLSEETEASSTGERSLSAIRKENDFTTVETSQIKHGELQELDSETRPLPLLHSSNGNLAVVQTGEIEDEVLEKADKYECMESGEATLLNEEASAEELTESPKDLEGIIESFTGDGTEITNSTEEHNLIAVSQATVDDQVVEKVIDVAGETTGFTTILPNNNTERNLVEVDQMKHEEYLGKESEIPSLLTLNTSTEEPTIVHEDKIKEHAEIILSNEEATEDSSKEENESTSVLCEDTETRSTEQESLIVLSHGDQAEETTIDMAQNAPDLTIIISEVNAEENSLIHLDGSQIKHEDPLEKENQTPSMSMLGTTTEDSTILQNRITDDQHLTEFDKFEREKDREVALLKEPTPDETVNYSTKDDPDDTKVFLLCEDHETTSFIDEQSQKANQQKTVVDQTQENIPDSATKVQDFKQTVSLEKAGENSLIQVDGSKVKHEIVSDETQENVLDITPKDQYFKPASSHDNAEENSLIQVDEIQMKHDELEKKSETSYLLMGDTSSEESRIIYDDITENDTLKNVNDFEHEKHVEISSTEEEAQVTKVNESSKEDLEDFKAHVSGEDSGTTSFEEKHSLKESPRQILSDQQEEKVLVVSEAQNFIDVSNENVERDSMIQEDGSKIVHEELLEKEGETPSLSAALILNTTSEDSIVIHENRIESEDTRKVDIFERHVDGKILDAAPEALQESKTIVLDVNTEEKSLDQVDKLQTKHEELWENEALLSTSKEDLTTSDDDKVEHEGPKKVDRLECEHTDLPSTKEEEPVQELNNPLKEDMEETKAIGSCLDTETTSSMEDRSRQINPQEVMGDQMEENIIDTTPETQNFTAVVSEENYKENLSLDVDESQIEHEELLENESEKPPLSNLETSNEESSYIRNSKTENEDVKRDEKAGQLNDFPIKGPENIKVSAPNDNLETSPIVERSLQENLTEDKILDVVPEALELKTIELDENIEENSTILEDGSRMKHEEHLEKESKKLSLTETPILNTWNEEPTLSLDEKIEDEDEEKFNKSECEKHAEITELTVETPNSSNLNIEAFVSCEDIEPTSSAEEQSLTANPMENVGGHKVEKVLDKALEALDFTPVVPDDNNDDNPSIQVDGSQMKHEELSEKEGKVPSLLETSLLNTNKEELETIHCDKKADVALKNVDEKKFSEVNELKEEVQEEGSMAYKKTKAYVSHQDIEASPLQEKILTPNPQDISRENFIDTADSKEKITENFPVSDVKESLIQINESDTKHEEILGREPYLAKTSTVEANKNSTTIHEGMIEGESGNIIENNTLLYEGSPAYASLESLQVDSQDIKASVSCQKTDISCSSLDADSQEIVEDQTDDKINTAGTRITLETSNSKTLVSNENEVLDSITPQDELEIERQEISMMADNEEPIIIHEDIIEGEDHEKVDTSKCVQQTDNTLSEEEAHVAISMDSLKVASEPIKASVSCQDRDRTSSSEEQSQTTTPQNVSDQVEEKVPDTGKTWEETPEVSSSILVFQEDETNRIGDDDINSVNVKDEEILNRETSSDEICFSDIVQEKEEEKEIISETKIDEEADKDDTWIKLPEDETDKTYIEVKDIDLSSHAEDTSEITQHDSVKDIPKGNENSTSKNEFLEDGCSRGSTESTRPIVDADVEQIDKYIKAERVITETGAASDTLPITGIQYGPEENESEDGKVKEIETSLAPECREYQGQHTKLYESPSPTFSHVNDSEWEMAKKRGTENLRSGDNMKELDEGSVVLSNERNFPEANLNENIEAEVTAGEKETYVIQQDPVLEIVVQEILERPGKIVEAVPGEKGKKSEQGETKYVDSDDLNINSSTMETDKVAPSDILCSSTGDAGQKAVGQETQIVGQEKEQKPGKGKAIEAISEEKGINTEEDEVKGPNSCILALDKVTPINILQSSTIDEGLKATDEETPEQRGLGGASLKEIEGGSASVTDKLKVLKVDPIDNANFDSSVCSNKTPVLKHGDPSESSHTEVEKQKASKFEKGLNDGSEETAKPTSESTEMDKPSLLGLLQEPVKEVSKGLDHLIDKKQPTTQEEELEAEKTAEVEHIEEKTDEEKDGELESGGHQISDLSYDTLVMVDAADKDVKVAHKKSHSILSGVGSKVKHSISKVKKAITGKSSHPKSASPKYAEKI